MAGIFGKGLLMVSAVAVLYLAGTSNAVQTKLDSINVDRYLANTPLVEEHMRCLIYSGLFFTYRYTGITTSRCGVCTPEQEQKLGRIALHWQQNYPQEWSQLTTFLASG